MPRPALLAVLFALGSSLPAGATGLGDPAADRTLVRRPYAAVPPTVLMGARVTAVGEPRCRIVVSREKRGRRTAERCEERLLVERAPRHLVTFPGPVGYGDIGAVWVPKGAPVDWPGLWPGFDHAFR